METSTPSNKPTQERVYLIIIAVLTLAVGVLSYQLITLRTSYQQISMQRSNLEGERNDLKEELNSMLQQYDKLKTDNNKLTAEMQAQKDQIKNLLDQIEKNKGNVTLIAKYRREVVTLRTIMKSYVVTIDSLNTVNQQLTEENVQVKTELGSVKNRAEELAGKNAEMSGLIAKASILKASGLTASALRLRSSGRQQETDRAKNCELFKLCFTLNENKTTQAGNKTLYLKISKPNGALATAALETIPVGGVGEAISAKKTVNYTNSDIDLCLFANASADLPIGKYKLELFESNTLIATSYLELK